MQEGQPAPVDAPTVQVFRADRPRSHAAWATLGVCAYWVGLFLIVGWAQEGAGGGLSVMLWFCWQFFGVGALPYAARRVDEGLGRRRGDLRALHRPYVTAAAAFAGSIAGLTALVGALVATSHKLPALGAEAVLVAVMVVGAWLGARLVARGSAAREVSVGYDALTYVNGHRTTVVALRDITAVPSALQRVEVHRRDGAPLVIDLRGTGIDDRALGPVIDRAARAAREAVPVGAALRREDRALDAWRESLRAKALGGTDFRAQALDRDDLESALVHPGATAEERIGAALALRALDDAGATRVRVAAEAALDPALRDALRAVAEGTVDDALVRKATRA